MLPLAPAIALDGPKGVGKTDTAARRAATTWFLDDPAQRDVAAADFRLAAIPDGTLLLDEWQKLPQVWDAVRRQVDAGAPPGRFLLTGSATPVDAAATHSGAGRILSLRMRPMALHERGVTEPTVSFCELLAGRSPGIGGDTAFALLDCAEEIVRGGSPGIMNSAPRLRRGMLDAYMQRVIDRDLADHGYEVRRPETLRRWLLAPSVTDSDVRHLRWLREQLPDRVIDLLVVTTGPMAYRRPDGIAVVPIALLGP